MMRTSRHVKLTQASVKRLAPLKSADLYVWDSDLAGFGLRVKPSGVKSYLVQYRNRLGTSKRKTIAQAAVMSADDARKEARLLLADVQRGRDPAAEFKAGREAWTVGDLADHWRKHHAPKLRPSTRVRQEYLLTAHLLPKLKGKAVADLSALDVRRWFGDVSGHGPVMANNARALLSKMLALAVEQGIRTDNPVAAVRKHAETPRTRYLSAAEIGRFLLACDGHYEPRMATYFHLLLLTGARKGELLQSRWAEFDLDGAVWSKPSAHTKQKRDHQIPLSSDAVALLRAMKRAAPLGFPWVFPGVDRDGRPQGAMVEPKRHWRMIRDAAKLADVSIHTLRHTHASVLVGAGKTLPQIGRTLGHTQARTTERYAHLDLGGIRDMPGVVAQIAAAAHAQAKHDAEEDAKVPKGTTVVPLRKKHR